MRRYGVVVVVLALCAPAAAEAHLLSQATQTLTIPALPTSSTASSVIGHFSPPFEEPGPKCITDARGLTICKPTAGSVTVLSNGKVLYWNALEGTEQVDVNIVAEYGRDAINDQVRLLDLAGPSWSTSNPFDAGANPDGYDDSALFPGGNDEPWNDGALFCSDMNVLPDGRVLAIGGTAYYLDPEVGETNLGVSELEGLRNARIYDPASNTWSQAGMMRTGRWYPTLITLPDGNQIAASGVTKLLKPLYPDAPADSGTNVKRMERFDLQNKTWSDEGPSAERSLPLYPRLHLLPNGHIFYSPAGQSFNPMGQSYDEAVWNMAGAYDPVAKRWTDLGIPGLDGGTLDDLQNFDFGDPVGDISGFGLPGGGRSLTLPGFRGSTFDVMLPLEPPYTRARFLSAGGVLNPPSPGSYFTTSDSRIITVDVSSGQPRMSTRATGDMSRPRWYPSGVLLPTGEVAAFSGADRDEVVGPGTEIPNKQAELFDPATESWKPMAVANRARTYHNTATLLPDGRVLIGGHAPISTLYMRNMTLVEGVTAPNDGRDPSFEIYSPPYLFRGARPQLLEVSDNSITPGETFNVLVDDASADSVQKVVLVRNTTVTHLVDADQRSVVVPTVRREGSRLYVSTPANPAVLPPGPYHVFVIRNTAAGPIPSEAEQVFVQ